MRMQRLIVYCALLGLARRPRIRRDPPIASHSSFASCWLLQAPPSIRRVRPVFLDIYVRNELTHQHALTCQRARSSRSAEHFLGTVQTQTPTHGPEVGTAARNFQPRIQGRSLRKWLWKCT
jgi:hypothetical protein